MGATPQPRTLDRPGTRERLQRNWLRATFQTRLALLSRLGRQCGTAARSDGAQEVIVSMTTIPQRWHETYLTVESLLRQAIRPQRVILWLGQEQTAVPLPRRLQRQQERGLEVRFRPDVGPGTKLIHALREHPHALILTADDDTLYPSTWLGELLESYRELPAAIHAHRAHWMCSQAGGAPRPYRAWKLLAPGLVGPAHRLFPTGVGGVLYPPGSLDGEVFNEAALLKLCPTADDVWFKAMALLKRVPARKIRPVAEGFPTIRSAKHTGLSLTNLQNAVYDRQIQAVFQQYDLAQFLEPEA